MVPMPVFLNGIDQDTGPRINATNADLKVSTEKFLQYFMRTAI
jgi:hypothetical protein